MTAEAAAAALIELQRQLAIAHADIDALQVPVHLIHLAPSICRLQSHLPWQPHQS